jgi:hypothetical protein
MRIKAHHQSGSAIAGPIGRPVAVLCVCVLSIALTVSADASASAPTTATLGTVAQTATQALPSAASTTVQQVAGSPLPPSPPPTPEQPAAPPRQATPAITVASPQPSEPHGAVAREAVARIAPTSDMPRGEGHGAIQTIVHTTTAGAGGALRSAPVAGVVRDVSSSRAGDVTRAVTQTLTDAASTRVVRTLADKASTLTTTVTRTTRLGDTVKQLAASVAGPVLARLQTVQRGGSAPAFDAPPRHAFVVPASLTGPSQTLAAPSLPTSAAPSGAGLSLAPATALARADFGRWSAWALTASAGGRAAGAAAERRPTPGLLMHGRSSASSAVQGAHPAPLPASPVPTPSPGGVSPAAVVAAAAGISMGLALAALLMLATPIAARRLRLDGESWRLAPLMLIADRPG